MAEKVKYRGIRMNHCLFQGEITADPVFSGGYAFLTLNSFILQKGEDGRFGEAEQDVPLIVDPAGPLAVVEKHIKAGRKLAAWCQYKSWMAGGIPCHGFVVKHFDLGDKPFEGDAPPTTVH